MEKFSEMIARSRKEKGLSVRELSKALNDKGYSISFAFINFIETERKKPSYSVAYALADVLDIDLKKALTLAYLARIEHNKQLEKNYLEEFIYDKSIESVTAEEVMKAEHID